LRRASTTSACATALLLAALVHPGRAAEPPAQPSFTILAIGDTGERTIDLSRNAEDIADAARALTKEKGALIFLGDNFYEHGLADETPDRRNQLFYDLYGRWFGQSFDALGMEERGSRDAPPTLDEKAQAHVHAIAGNHDYYSKRASTLFGNISPVPLGFSTAGNAYEALRKEWAYHYGQVGRARWGFGKSHDAADKNGVQAIFLDSSVLIRSDWDQVDCEVAPPFEKLPKDADPLSCAVRRRIKQDLVEALRRHAKENVWRVLVTHHPLDTVGEHGGATWVPDARGRGGEIVMQDLCSKTRRPRDYFKNLVDPEDSCTTASRKYVELVLEAIKDAETDEGARIPVHVVLSGHDHSLQLLDLRRPREWNDPLTRRINGMAPDLLRLPGVQVVSGAGAKVSAVQASSPDQGRITTNRGCDDQAPVGESRGWKKVGESSWCHDVNRRGESRSGWIRLQFQARTVDVTFHSGRRDITKDISDRERITLVLDAQDRLRLAPKEGVR
jgi:hypothetical protein